jgi:hypothetical protein
LAEWKENLQAGVGKAFPWHYWRVDRVLNVDKIYEVMQFMSSPLAIFLLLPSPQHLPG